MIRLAERGDVHITISRSEWDQEVVPFLPVILHDAIKRARERVTERSGVHAPLDTLEITIKDPE